MSIISRLSRFVDWDLKTGGVQAGACSLLILIVAVFPLVATRSIIGVVVAATFATVWLAFVGWRAWRLFKAIGIKGDRKFDREDKFKLPPEYAASESVTRAHQRTRIERKAR